MIRSAVEIAVARDDSSITLKLEGPLNERFDIARCLAEIRQERRIVINAQGVSDINSNGVRNWLLLLEKLPTDRTVEFEAVSIPLVEQANMIVTCLNRGRVLSFMAPYFCAKCEAPQSCLLSPADPHVTRSEAPPCSCSKCGGSLDFDDDAKEYFTFLRSSPSGN